MRIIWTLMKAGFRQQARSQWLFVYALLYFGVTHGLLQFDAQQGKAVASLISLVLLLNPTVALIYSTVYWYASANFNQLLLIQPICREHVFGSTWLAISIGLSATFGAGATIAFAINGAAWQDLSQLLLVGTFLHLIFSSLGIFCAIWITDRLKGIAAALALWLYFSVIHGAILFLLLTAFSNYPMDTLAFLLMMANPMDVARLYLLFQYDLAALMGYTGSLLQQLADSGWGAACFAAGLFLWAMALPYFTLRVFRRRDL